MQVKTRASFTWNWPTAATWASTRAVSYTRTPWRGWTGPWWPSSGVWCSTTTNRPWNRRQLKPFEPQELSSGWFVNCFYSEGAPNRFEFRASLWLIVRAGVRFSCTSHTSDLYVGVVVSAGCLKKMHDGSDVGSFYKVRRWSGKCVYALQKAEKFVFFKRRNIQPFKKISFIFDRSSEQLRSEFC